MVLPLLLWVVVVLLLPLILSMCCSCSRCGCATPNIECFAGWAPSLLMQLSRQRKVPMEAVVILPFVVHCALPPPLKALPYVVYPAMLLAC